jgi:osmoprotectant transport system ATP-binding protein
MGMPIAIEFRETSFQTPQGRTLLDRVSLQIQEGSTAVLLGRSGSGKTTLLRMVNRMVDPTGGAVLLHGRELREYELIALRRGIGYVIQETGLFPHLTIERNVSLVLEAKGAGKAQRVERSHTLLEMAGLDPAVYARRYPHQLSGGQRQRAGLARALAADAPILLMDEPFGALDPLTRAEMQDMLRALLARMRKTVLLVSHDLNEALYLGNTISLMEEGRILTTLNPKEFLKSDMPAVQRYVQAYYRGAESQEEHP